MKRSLLFLALISSTLFSLSSNAAKLDLSNPKPADDDVIVPMPCNMTMAFRKVYTSYDKNQIKDKTFMAGSQGESDILSESLNKRNIQGSFKDKKGYYYLMAKYELTQGQYDALTKDKCPKMTPKSGMPATKITYFDAQNAAHLYSNFLQKSENVPTYGGSKAFARLPLDSEFEFAVRGGIASSKAEFDANLPPMTGDLNDYVVYQGPESSNNKISRVGSRKPNSLGIYDLLGNAGEMVHDYFMATRTGRLHGQAGGFIVRGGSFLTAQGEISSSYRKERAFYANGKENRSIDTSTRFVLSVPVVLDLKTLNTLKTEISKLGDDSDTTDTKGANKNTVKSLESVIEKQKAAQEANKKLMDKSNKELKDEKALTLVLKKQNESLSKELSEMGGALKVLKQDIVAANAARDEMRDEAIASNIRIGALMCSLVSDYKKTQVISSKRVALFEDLAKSDESYKESLQKAKAQHDAANADLNMITDTYGSIIAMTTSTYDIKLVKKQIDRSYESIGALSGNYMLKLFTNNFISDLESYSKDKKRDLKKNHEKWINACFTIGKKTDVK